jgi:hypothetical protein
LKINDEKDAADKEAIRRVIYFNIWSGLRTYLKNRGENHSKNSLLPI